MTVAQRTSALLLVTILVASVPAGTAALAGAAGAADPSGTASTHPTDAATPAPDAEIENGSGYWVGRTLSSDDYDAGASVELYRQDGDSWLFLTAVPVNDSGVAIVDTTGFEVGTYELRSDGASNLRFDLRQQSLAVTAEPSTVSSEPDGPSETTFRIESNRDAYQLAVVSDELTPAEMQTTLGVEGVSYDVDGDGDTGERSDGLVLTNRTFDTSSTLDANFSGRKPGIYELSFVVTDASVRASTNVSVPIVDPGTAGFEPSLYTATEGESVIIDVRISNAETAAVTISSDAGYEANLTLRDSDGDGEVLVSIDSTTNGTVSYTTRGPDSLTVDGAEGTFDPAEYRLDVRVGQDPTAPPQNVGRLVVEQTGTTGTTATDGTATANPTTHGTTRTNTATGGIPSTTPSDATPSAESATTELSQTTSDGGTPGFGVAVAAVGIVTIALLGRRVY
ncbi:DUF7827 domain-containing protein [Haloarchaeobius baliensis]|uniref:DUF7827 domain-containing protein n=1 Tax=Haloarchaeobius baliensis TaxID=1670458 RepID=UPI003F8853DD